MSFRGAEIRYKKARFPPFAIFRNAPINARYGRTFAVPGREGRYPAQSCRPRRPQVTAGSPGSLPRMPLIVWTTTNAPSGPGRQSHSMSRQAVPNSNHCIRLRLPFRVAVRRRGVGRPEPKAGIAIFRNELGKKLEKSSDNGCMFSLMSAETLSHGGKR